MMKLKRLILKRLLPTYVVMYWLELALLKISKSKDISNWKKVIELIDSSSTHNFIHNRLAKVLNYLGKCHNINLTIREYVFNSPMISIQMGGDNVVLGL